MSVHIVQHKKIVFAMAQLVWYTKTMKQILLHFPHIMICHFKVHGVCFVRVLYPILPEYCYTRRLLCCSVGFKFFPLLILFRLFVLLFTAELWYLYLLVETSHFFLAFVGQISFTGQDQWIFHSTFSVWWCQLIQSIYRRCTTTNTVGTVICI